jgi:hypothetical protein
MRKGIQLETAMKLLQVSVQGTLKPDGTLELKEAPALPPGPVEVLVRSLSVAVNGEENWWDYLQRARAELLAQGHTFRSKAEIDADRDRHRELDQVREKMLDRPSTAVK